MITTEITPLPTHLQGRFWERVVALYGAAQAERILKVWGQDRKTGLRINSLKADQSVIKELTDVGIKVTPSAISSFSFSLAASDKAKLVALPAWEQGQVYIQDLSSQLVTIILDPQPTDSILDLAAAPGSKTSHMAALMNNQGLILANDISPKRLSKLRNNLAQLGVTNVKSEVNRGETLWKKFPHVFDKVLVDVPCTMEGRINFAQPKTWIDWAEKESKILAKRQRWLLGSAISACAPGGLVVYSTCTLAPEENEAVVNWVLRHAKENIEVESLTEYAHKMHAHATVVSGLTQWDDHEYSPQLSNSLRIIPSQAAEGFFVTALRVKSITR